MSAELVPVTRRDGVSEADFRRHAEVLREHVSLTDVLAWCRQQDPPRDAADVVIQDEFTHDVVVPLGGSLFAVYDTT